MAAMTPLVLHAVRMLALYLSRMVSDDEFSVNRCTSRFGLGLHRLPYRNLQKFYSHG